MLFKCGMTHTMFYYNSLSTIIKCIDAIHSPCETICYRAAFARTLVYERETTTFLTTDNLNDILNAICTE